MHNVIRLAPVLALLALAPERVHAQERQIEVRIDALSYSQSTGRSSIDLRIPGAAAVAVYLNDHVALESRLLGISRSQTDGSGTTPDVTVTTLSAALFVPLHFGNGRGRRGLFVAPGILVNRSSFSTDSDVVIEPGTRTTTNLGLDVGFKHTLKGRVSWRHALTFRTGDDLPDTFGATSGISIFFR